METEATRKGSEMDLAREQIAIERLWRKAKAIKDHAEYRLAMDEVDRRLAIWQVAVEAEAIAKGELVIV